MENTEFEKAKAFNIADILEYIPNSVVIRTIARKITGVISRVSFDAGEGISEKISPFDSLVQIIDGKAEIIINGHSHLLETGQFIIIPCHQRSSIKANVRFQMITTTIKSGYEEITERS